MSMYKVGDIFIESELPLQGADLLTDDAAKKVRDNHQATVEALVKQLKDTPSTANLQAQLDQINKRLNTKGI